MMADVMFWAIVVAVAFSVGPWVPDAASGLVKRSRGRKKTDDWGPTPDPPAFTRWTRCSECRATYAHKVLLGVRESALCKRCKEQERLPL